MTPPTSNADAVTLHSARVVLADDHPAIFALATAALSDCCVVVGTATNGRELLAAVEECHPDVAVLDVGMPDLNGIEAAHELHLSHPSIKLVFLTVQQDPDYARAAFDEGAHAYVVKSRLASDLLPAVRAALEDHRFLSPNITLQGGA